MNCERNPTAEDVEAILVIEKIMPYILVAIFALLIFVLA